MILVYDASSKMKDAEEEESVPVHRVVELVEMRRVKLWPVASSGQDCVREGVDRYCTWYWYLVPVRVRYRLLPSSQQRRKDEKYIRLKMKHVEETSQQKIFELAC